MTPLAEVLRRVAADLDALHAKYALVGGLAVSVRTEPRFTRDVDVAVAASSDEEAEALVRDLRGRGYQVVAHLEQEATGRLATVRLTAAHGAVVDVMFASSGIEAEVIAAAESLEVLPGVSVPVATVAHLLALKVLARDDKKRPQDRADAVALVGGLDAEGLEETRAALTLIRDRGYGRKRDLPGDLDRLLAELA